jgi:hypothetical protein
MSEQDDVWDYCEIRFQLRYKGEDYTRSGMKHVWLVFQALTTESRKNPIIRESIEIPVPGNVLGGALTPQKNNASHLNIHQDLMLQLRIDGWEVLPEQGGAWWEKRLRRRASLRPPSKKPFWRL